MSPLPTRSAGINASGVSSTHGLFACAGDDGLLECFDMRARSSAGVLDAASAIGAPGQVWIAVTLVPCRSHVWLLLDCIGASRLQCPRCMFYYPVSVWCL